MQTCPCDVDPLTPNFYIVQTGVYKDIQVSYFCSKTLIVGTRYDRLNEAVLTCTHNQCFEQKYEKYLSFFS